MRIIDIIILILLGFGALLGFKRGFTIQLVSLIGIFVIILLSFVLKNPISVFLYKNLPFFKFGGIFKDITVLNILVYETIAFIIVFLVLTLIFRILLKVTKIFEKILAATIILGIPSKILGSILGIIESIIYIFIILYVLSLPMFNIDLSNSKISSVILNKTPILHKVCDKTLNAFDDIIELKEEYKNTNDTNSLNQKALNAMINNGIITKKNASELIKSGKISNVNIE